MKVQLHIHSCLSPCADSGMTPGLIAGMAAVENIGVIALCDHNTCQNSRACAEAARHYGIVCVPAMELTTSEEVHMLLYFGDLDRAEAFSEVVYATLADIRPDPRLFGEQLVMDTEDRVLRREDKKLLSAASGIGVYDLGPLSGTYGFFAVPAHIDRSSFSLLSNLGFYEPSMNFSVFELSQSAEARAVAQKNPELRGMRYLRGCDAHTVSGLPDSGFEIAADPCSAAELLGALRDGADLPVF